MRKVVLHTYYGAKFQETVQKSTFVSEARRNFKLRFLQQIGYFLREKFFRNRLVVFFLLWHFVEVSYNGSNFRNFELFSPEFPSKRNPPHGTIDRSPVAGLRLSNASPPYIGHGIDGRNARVFLSFFFFFWLSTFSSSSGERQRFFRRVTPPVWTSPGLPTCRIDRPSSCPIDPGVQKFFAQRRTSTDRAETFSDQPSNPKESLDERPHFLRRITSPV